MDIRIVRLVTGEELLTEVLRETPDVQVKNPVRVVMVPGKNQHDGPGIGLAPFGEFAEEKTFSFKKEHVLLVYKPVNEFVNQYQGMFSKIITPPTKGGRLILPTE